MASGLGSMLRMGKGNTSLCTSLSPPLPIRSMADAQTIRFKITLLSHRQGIHFPGEPIRHTRRL